VTSIRAITQNREVGRGEVEAGAAAGGPPRDLFFSSVRIGMGLRAGFYARTGVVAFVCSVQRARLGRPTSCR
jgi:hypothetical protein